MVKYKLNTNCHPMALRVKEKYDISLKTPNKLIGCEAPRSIAAILHVYYPDLMTEIAECINNFEYCPDLFISTDSNEKAQQIKEFCLQYHHWHVDIRVVENRGRDIAPMIVEFHDVFYQYEYCLHLHTKKTLHKSAVAKWREYLFYTLCGTPDIVASNLALLQNDKIGFIFPQNINVFRHNLSWGTRFENVRQLLAKSSISIYSDTILEFPTSTMFIAKTDALKKLLEQYLRLSDFDLEDRQITATLAHDIETSLLYFVEASGYRWVKISYNHGKMILVRNMGDVDTYLDKIAPLLLPRITIEYEQLLSRIVVEPSIIGKFVQKAFNAWQKVLFKFWTPKILCRFNIKEIRDCHD